MTMKTTPLAGILSWMVIASLAVLSTDTAWSESPQNTQSKKSTAKKPAVKKSKVVTKKRAQPSAASSKSPPIVGNTTPVAQTYPTAGAAQPITTAPITTTPITAISTQTTPIASAPAQPQVSGNAYMTAQQPNPWQVQVYKAAPANVNPYLAYRYAAPAGAPWNTATIQVPQFAQPTWVNPFLAFQQPSLPPSNPWTLPTFQAPQFTPPAWVNPYLAYRQPVVPTTPWTPPAFQMPQLAAPTWVNPIQATPLAALPTPWAPPAFEASAPVVAPAWAGNPYLAYQRIPAPAPAAQADPVKPAAVVQAAQASPSPSDDRIAAPTSTPWSTPSPAIAVKPAENAAPTKSLGQMWDSLKFTLLPSMPPSDQAILPTVKTVYPTGEKPLKVLTFKCPTELIGITPLPTKALHGLVNVAMDGINRADLLPFNMQQVCQ